MVVGSEGGLLDERWKLGVGYWWSGGGDLIGKMSCLKRQYNFLMLVLRTNHLTCISLCLFGRMYDLCYPYIHYFLTNDSLSYHKYTVEKYKVPHRKLNKT